ncbi:MAG: S9 family peptidase [Dehalococcoidia bacterium]
MDHQPPKAPQKPRELVTHGDIRNDPWFWLRDLEDADTLEYLKAENAYTEAVMKPTEESQQQLFEEMRARIKEDDSSVPEKEGEYYYYTRFAENQQYPIHCRKRHSLDGEEEVLIDVNELGQGQDYIQVGFWENSPDHHWLAYAADNDGSEQYTIYVKDLDTGELLADTIPNAYYSLEWASDSQTFFYNVLDQNHRPVRVFRHRLGEDPSQDPLVYEEQDERFFVGLHQSASRRFIYIASEGNNMSEWYFVESAHPEGELRRIEPRQTDFEYDVTDHGDRFLILHNGDGAKDFKISETPVAAPARENWVDLVPHEAGRPLRRIQAFRDYLIISYRRQGLPQIRVMDLSADQVHDIAFDEEDFSVRAHGSREWDTANLRFSYTSLTTPATTYDYDMGTRQREFRKQTEVLGSFTPEDYRTRRLLAPAQDGTLIPISLMYHQDTALDGSAPLYLYGYGSYGLVMEAEFGSTRLSLVDRGIIFAIAHVRGGMEMGWDWYEEGRLLRKQNTFSDFIDCAEYLIGEGYTARGHIVASGGSAGGMLMGAIANLNPGLFQAIIAHVPFVDVLNTMLDDTLPLTTLEYNEWGNPQQQQYYDYIKSYSPYDNITAQDYPHLLITGGISDPRVTYWEPTKWVAKLRELKTDDNLLLLKIHMESGHAGASGRFERLKEIALEYAFIFKVFGME